MLNKYTDLDIQDYVAVLHLKDEFKVSEKRVDEDSWMAHKTLKELDLRHEGITILGIDRKDCDYIGSPTGSFEIFPKDVVTVYGKADVIKNLFSRKNDFVASVSHQEYVEKENERIEKQKAGRNKPKNTETD